MQIKAKRECWQGFKVEGERWERYPLSLFPVNWQAIIREKLELVGSAHPTAEKKDSIYIESQASVAEAEAGETPETSTHNAPVSSSKAEGRRQKAEGSAVLLEVFDQVERPDGPRAEVRAQARAWVLQLVQPWCCQQGIEKAVDCEQQFCNHYNRGRVPVPGWVREFVKKTSRATLHRWRQRRDLPTPEGQINLPLSGHFERQKGGLIRNTPELEKRVWAIIEQLGLVACGPVNVHRKLEQLDLPPEISPSYAQTLRYLQWFERERRAHFLYLASPKDFRNKVEVAIGRLDQDLEPNDRWQLDFTRNDVLLQLEGKVARFAVGMVIDIATRRRKVLLSPVPKGITTALLVTQAILEWGMPVELRPDNGKEFINKRVTGLTNTLGIIVNPCLPGKPQEKGNVEKALGDFVKACEAEPSFIGHNVSDRQRIREAKGEEYLISKAVPFEVFQAWCDNWCEQVHNRPHRGVGMEGMSPNERLEHFIAQGWQPTPCDRTEEELTRLAFSKVVTARRDCVVWDTRRYITENLGLVSAGDRLRICLDGMDLRQVHVYSEDFSQYFGIAKWEIALSKEEMIAAAQKGKAIQKATLEGVKAGAKEGKKLAELWEKRPDLAVAANADLVAQQRITESVGDAVAGELGEYSPATSQGNVVAFAVKPATLDPDAEAMKAKLWEEFNQPKAPEIDPVKQATEWKEKIYRLFLYDYVGEGQGALDADEAAWWATYKETPTGQADWKAAQREYVWQLQQARQSAAG
jgi:hypothetical protein